MMEMQLEVYDAYDQQYLPSFRNLRFAKVFQGGEDLWLSFDLDRDISINYPDVAYGNGVILRRGLKAIWKGEMQVITQGKDAITVNCAGLWVKLEDKSHGGKNRLWSDSRWKKWNPTTRGDIFAGLLFASEKYEMDTGNHLFIAPRKNERFTAGMVYGAIVYIVDFGADPQPSIKRVSFDYDIDFAWTTNFHLELLSFSTAAASVVEWDPGVGAVGSGAKDVTLVNVGGGAYMLMFRMECAGVGWTTYTGNTGEDIYAEITNLRLWGQTTESPSIIHVAEEVIDEVGPLWPW